jgi:hypothetical protein
MSVGKPKYSEKTCPSVALSTTNPTLHDLDWNSDHRNGTARYFYVVPVRPQARAGDLVEGVSLNACTRRALVKFVKLCSNRAGVTEYLHFPAATQA